MELIRGGQAWIVGAADPVPPAMGTLGGGKERAYAGFHVYSLGLPERRHFFPSRKTSGRASASDPGIRDDMTETRTMPVDRWSDDDEAQAASSWRRWTRQEVQALSREQPSLSPWRVVAVQAGVGLLVSLVCWWVVGERAAGWSALYGAAVVVGPSALMARGMTSRFSSVSPGVSAVSFMLWELLKISVSVVMLVLAPKLVQSLSWPALLVALVVCIKVYWFALMWRGR